MYRITPNGVKLLKELKSVQADLSDIDEMPDSQKKIGIAFG